MAKDKITEYDATANNNTVCGDVNIAENSALPSDMNNFAREIMSHLKEGLGSGTPLYVDQTNNRVGIGTSSPTAPLHIQASTTPYVAFQDGTNYLNVGVVSSNYSVVNSSLPIAFQISNSEKVRITSTNVGINTSSPSSGYMLHVGGSSGVHTKVKIEATTATGQAELDLSADPAGVSYLNLGDEDSYNIGYLGYFHSDNSMRFQTNSSERLRINSVGSLLLNKSSATTSGGGAFFETPTNVSTMPMYLRFCKTYSGTREAVSFHHNGSYVGGILYDNSSINYATTSDYRLKENIVTDWDATTRLKQLNPVRFNFIADADRTVDGFLAHEVQSVVPESITGTHNEVDDDGNPVYQGIDQSKLVPLLVKTIQELEARIVALETA